MPKIALIEYVKMPKLALLESIPQTHILLCLAGQNPTLIIGRDSAEFVVTFATSFLSASFVLLKFLKTGPCRLAPDRRRFLRNNFFQSYATVNNTDFYLNYNFWTTYYIVLTNISSVVEF